VPVAAVGGVAELGEAVSAGGDVGGGQGARGAAAVAGRVDGEPGPPLELQLRLHHPLDDREGRGVRAQPARELHDRSGLAFDLDNHSGVGVADRAAQRQVGRGDIDERAEAHTLNDAIDLVPAPNPWRLDEPGHVPTPDDLCQPSSRL